MWKFLDQLNRNLLYSYVLLLTGKRKNKSVVFTKAETNDEETNNLVNAEQKRNAAIYLVWFVFRYVLECDTYEKALPYANIDTLKKYKLDTFFRANQRYIYIGAYGIDELYLYNCEKGCDLTVLLEILYNRYDCLEQLECFIRQSLQISPKITLRVSGCQKTLEKTVEMITGKPEYEEMLNSYYKRKEQNNV